MDEVVYLEHTLIRMMHSHPTGTCRGKFCTIHKRSDHNLRHMRQSWRADRHFMERICDHGVGHPDPDEFMADVWVHGCDGCCAIEKED